MKSTTIHIRNKGTRLILRERSQVRGTGVRDTRSAPGPTEKSADRPKPIGNR